MITKKNLPQLINVKKEKIGTYKIKYYYCIRDSRVFSDPYIGMYEYNTKYYKIKIIQMENRFCQQQISRLYNNFLIL